MVSKHEWFFFTIGDRRTKEMEVLILKRFEGLEHHFQARIPSFVITSLVAQTWHGWSQEDNNQLLYREIMLGTAQESDFCCRLIVTTDEKIWLGFNSWLPLAHKRHTLKIVTNSTLRSYLWLLCMTIEKYYAWVVDAICICHVSSNI